MFNTDQGCQYTARAFTGWLEERGVAVSMDGRGRALDNVFIERLWRSVKHEEVYLRGYDKVAEAHAGLSSYFAFYNGRRRHSVAGAADACGGLRRGAGGLKNRKLDGLSAESLAGKSDE